MQETTIHFDLTTVIKADKAIAEKVMVQIKEALEWAFEEIDLSRLGDVTMQEYSLEGVIDHKVRFEEIASYLSERVEGGDIGAHEVHRYIAASGLLPTTEFIEDMELRMGKRSPE